MFYGMIGCVALFLGYIVYESIMVARFISYKKAMNATFLADRFFVCMLWIIAVLYIALFAVSFAEEFVHILRYPEDSFRPLYLVALVFPMAVISYRLVLSQGLYAYTEKDLLSFGNHSIPFADLTIVKENPNWPYNIKAVVKPTAQSKRANKKIWIRTNNSHNFYLLQKLIKAENA
jgi:hypothetical protein